MTSQSSTDTLALQGTNGSAGALVTTVRATDDDIGENGQVQYSLFGIGTRYFSIDSDTGDIRVSSSGVDFEVVNPMGNPLQLIIIAQDNGM